MAIKFPRPLQALADASGVCIWTLYKIEEGKREATPKQAIALEKATGGEVHRTMTRPDIWPPDTTVPAA